MRGELLSADLSKQAGPASSTDLGVHTAKWGSGHIALSMFIKILLSLFKNTY